ncbi:MAG: hypothetical protein JW940_24565 [Polyangiaceae bacterium]|nr:hypothetical protein [Polyangiaceae bacterium]
MVRFLRDHPEDPTARLVRVYLAWAVLGQHRASEAARLIAPVLAGKAGPARDGAVIVAAAIAIEHKQPERALALLRPLDGRVIDADQMLDFNEQSVRAAVAARRWPQAVRWTERWLARAPAYTLERVHQAARELLLAIPDSALDASSLERELAPRSSDDPASQNARRWLWDVLRERLASVALREQDPALARRLLESAPAQWRAGSRGLAVSKVAAGTLTRPKIVGRALGFAFTVGSADSRRRSASVARGLSQVLAAAGRAPSEGQTKLLTREDPGETGHLRETLGLLAGDGAALLVAAISAAAADEAAQYADDARIPTLLLAFPSTHPAADGYAFVLGLQDQIVLDAIRRATEALLPRAVATVGGDGGAACDNMPEQPGQSRFPLEDWRTRRVDMVVLLGSPSCTRDALGELRRSGLRPRLVFGLQSGEVASDISWPATCLVLKAGDFPDASRNEPPDGRMAGMGRASWYELLGRDAARLGTSALSALPAEGATAEPTRVNELHEQAARGLARAEAVLSTSTETGFRGGRVLARDLELMDAAGTLPPRSGRRQ